MIKSLPKGLLKLVSEVVNPSFHENWSAEWSHHPDRSVALAAHLKSHLEQNGIEVNQVHNTKRTHDSFTRETGEQGKWSLSGIELHVDRKHQHTVTGHIMNALDKVPGVEQHGQHHNVSRFDSPSGRYEPSDASLVGKANGAIHKVEVRHSNSPTGDVVVHVNALKTREGN